MATQAKQLGVNEPNGLILSTTGPDNKPSSRVVLLKSIDELGVTFATSANSNKGIDILNNAAVAGTLW